MRCVCGRYLREDDEHALYAKVFGHLRREHGVSGFEEEGIRELVAARSYRYEYVAAGPGAAEPDEEFGPEPY